MTELILHHERDATGEMKRMLRGLIQQLGARLGPGDKVCLPARQGEAGFEPGGLPGSQVIPQTGIKNFWGCLGIWLVYWVLWASVFPFLGRGGHQSMPMTPRQTSLCPIFFVFLCYFRDRSPPNSRKCQIVFGFRKTNKCKSMLITH